MTTDDPLLEVPPADARDQAAALVEPTRIDTWACQLPYDAPPVAANKTHNPLAVNALRKKHGALLANHLLGVFHPYGWELVEGELIWIRRDNRRADSDNISPSWKPIADALVKAGVLAEDDHNHVFRTCQRVVPKRLDPHPELGARVLLVLHRLEVREGAS